MGKGESKFELILLFDRLHKEPKFVHRWLKERGQDYSYYTLKKYYGHYATAKMIVDGIFETKSFKKLEDENGK